MAAVINKIKVSGGSDTGEVIVDGFIKYNPGARIEVGGGLSTTDLYNEYRKNGGTLSLQDFINTLVNAGNSTLTVNWSLAQW